MRDRIDTGSGVSTLRHALVAHVRRDGPDLSLRQLGVFLICYLEDGPHTVRGLAVRLGVAKPAVSRALDRLGELDRIRRAEDPSDRRSIVVQRTRTGNAFLQELRTSMETLTHAIWAGKTYGAASHQTGTPASPLQRLSPRPSTRGARLGVG